jgi:hypothetical protein
MLGIPKFNFGDRVKFDLNGKTYEGSIEIIDKYGVFEDDSDVSYDIVVVEKDEEILVKHVNESKFNVRKADGQA